MIKNIIPTILYKYYLIFSTNHFLILIPHFFIEYYNLNMYNNNREKKLTYRRNFMIINTNIKIKPTQELEKQIAEEIKIKDDDKKSIASILKEQEKNDESNTGTD